MCTAIVETTTEIHYRCWSGHLHLAPLPSIEDTAPHLVYLFFHSDSTWSTTVLRNSFRDEAKSASKLHYVCHLIFSDIARFGGTESVLILTPVLAWDFFITRWVQHSDVHRRLPSNSLTHARSLSVSYIFFGDRRKLMKKARRARRGKVELTHSRVDMGSPHGSWNVPNNEIRLKRILIHCSSTEYGIFHIPGMLYYQQWKPAYTSGRR